MRTPFTRLHRSALLGLALAAAGCPSDDPSSSDAGSVGDAAIDAGAPADAGRDAGAVDAGTPTPSDAGTHPGHDAALDAGPDAASPDAASPDDGGAAPDASMACATYCACMAAWCTDKVFPTSCLSACAAQTKWDLPCRQVHCTLVEPQPGNDHCTHAFGMVQCLDMP
jgi:hypothetical protein